RSVAAPTRYVSVGAGDLLVLVEGTPASTTFELEATIQSTSAYLRQAVNLAAAAGVNYSHLDNYDSDGDGQVDYGNNDGVVDHTELTVLVAEADPGQSGGGAVRTIDTFLPAGWTTGLGGDVAFVSHYADFQVFAHELSHILGTDDLYGASGLSGGLTPLGPSPGPHDDPATQVIEGVTHHIDPWHTIQLGWVNPVIKDLRDPGISLADIPLGAQPVILYDSALGEHAFHEYFILESRPATGNYDNAVT